MCRVLDIDEKGEIEMKSSKEIKLVIAGSREFEDYELLKFTVNELRKKYDIKEIVSGRARGADTLGEVYAEEHNIKCKYYPAEWNKYGKSAGYRRNVVMAEYADAVLVFWDGISRGTKHMIDIANNLHKPIKVVYYKGGII